MGGGFMKILRTAALRKPCVRGRSRELWEKINSERGFETWDV